MKRPIVGVLAMVGVLTAGPAPFASTAQQSPEGYPAAGEPPIVTLLSAGAEPRAALRYSVKPGQAASMEIGMLMSMAMDLDDVAAPEMQMPLMKFSADVSVTDVAPNGNISYRLNFTGHSLEDTAGVEPAILAAMRNMDFDVRGVQGTATMTPRGLTTAVEFDLSGVTNPQLKQTLGSMSSYAESLSMPLPEGAVGVGARWEVRQRSKFTDLVMFQKTTVEITAIEGETITLAMTQEQSAPSQSMGSPAMPPGAGARLLELAGTATGVSTLQLNTLVPNSNISGRTTMVMEVNLGDVTRTTTLAVTMKMTMSARR